MLPFELCRKDANSRDSFWHRSPALMLKNTYKVAIWEGKGMNISPEGISKDQLQAVENGIPWR